MDLSNLTVYATSTAVILGCAGVTYFFFKNKLLRKPRNATDALKYLRIRIVDHIDQCDGVVHELRTRSKFHHAIGFDCEWVTNQGRKRPVALLQLSTFDGYCALFRLNILKTVPNCLKELLEDKTIYKVGVAPVDDGKYLYQDYSVELKSSLDIRHIAYLCGHNAGGLGALSSSLLGIVLDKSWRVRCSDWEAEVLTPQQVSYAAADAHVAVRIFERLVNQLSFRTVWSLFLWKKRHMWDEVDKLCSHYLDVHYKAKNQSHGASTSKNKVPVIRDVAVPSNRYPNATRTKPLYHNCFLEAPDGELLCTCDNKKARWYVYKELADVVQEEPLRVRLRFEPAGRSVGETGRYYQLTKQNKCVVCGSTNSYIRKNVVPREYRKFFPEVMKDHSSHDVVLLCVSCHQRSNIADQGVRERLAAECAAPVGSRDCPKYTEDPTGKKIKSAARALLYQSRKHVLPEDRRRELEATLLQHYPQHEEVSEELLREAAETPVVFENSEYESHGQKVVEHYTRQPGGLLRLEQLWREHFLAVMQPRHMPYLWSVNHNEQRLRVRINEGRVSEEDLKVAGLFLNN